MRANTLFFAALLLVLGWTACNDTQQGSAYDAGDGQQNDIMDNSEADSAFTQSPYFKEWDQNSDQQVDENEFYQGYADMVDEDGDGTVNSEEWEQATNAYFGDYNDMPENTDEWDADGNGQLSKEEVVTALQDNDYYGNWDNNNNGELEEDEFAKNVFQNWDTDDDGFVQAEEYSRFHERKKE